MHSRLSLRHSPLVSAPLVVANTPSDNHRSFQIDGVADVNTTFVGFIRCEKERLEGAECRTELRELSTLLKFGLHVIQKIS